MRSLIEIWIDLESVIESEVVRKRKNKYQILTHICGNQKNGTNEFISRLGIKTQMQRTDMWAQGRERGWWNKLGDQDGCIDTKVLHSICQQIWKTQQWLQDWKMSFHSISKERQCQRIFILQNCTHFTCQQSNSPNSPSQASTVHEPRTFRCSSWIQKRQGNQRSNCQLPFYHRKSERGSGKHLLLLH